MPKNRCKGSTVPTHTGAFGAVSCGGGCPSGRLASEVGDSERQLYNIVSVRPNLGALSKRFDNVLKGSARHDGGCAKTGAAASSSSNANKGSLIKLASTSTARGDARQPARMCASRARPRSASSSESSQLRTKRSTRSSTMSRKEAGGTQVLTNNLPSSNAVSQPAGHVSSQSTGALLGKSPVSLLTDHNPSSEVRHSAGPAGS
mmetsp:Transcript_44444/g.117977  ORF Transcript_44444/g.117977 Transcript_44444/m.117977 type:complete len:204 (+) Transcript_44444:685-1296(+)